MIARRATFTTKCDATRRNPSIMKKTAERLNRSTDCSVGPAEECEQMSERSMSGDSTYQVNSHDWPLITGADVTVDAVIGVLAAFDRFHPEAVKALAHTAVPQEPSGQGSSS